MKTEDEMPLVCPQYAMTYFDGCHVTVAAGPEVVMRWTDCPVSVAHWILMSAQITSEKNHTYNFYVWAGTRNRDEFTVMREAQLVNLVSKICEYTSNQQMKERQRTRRTWLCLNISTRSCQRDLQWNRGHQTRDICLGDRMQLRHTLRHEQAVVRGLPTMDSP